MLEHEQGFHYVDQINKVVDRGLVIWVFLPLRGYKPYLVV